MVNKERWTRDTVNVDAVLELGDKEKLRLRLVDGLVLALKDAVLCGDCSDASDLCRELHKMCCGKEAH